MAYRFLIFDFDGTLADTLGWVAGVLPETARRFKFRYPGPEEREQLRGLQPKEMLSRLDIPLWKMPLITAHLRKEMNRQIHSLHLFPGMKEILEALYRSDIAMAVLSSNAEKNIRHVFGDQTAGYFTWYRCGTSFFGKDNKLRNLLAKSGMDPHETLYIGDEIRDLQASRSVGTGFGAVTWGLNDRHALQKLAPDFLFEKPEDLLNIPTASL